MTATSARVDVLTAEVRTLVVGSRQVTMSVYAQLDNVAPDQIEPFGRVHGKPDPTMPGRVRVVGRDRTTGALVRSSCYVASWGRLYELDPAKVATAEAWEALPLIVLAGLR